MPYAYLGNAVGGTTTYYDALGQVLAVRDLLFGSSGEPGIACSSILSGNYTACTNYTVGQVSRDTNYYISVTSIDPNQHVGVCCLNQFHSFFLACLQTRSLGSQRKRCSSFLALPHKFS